MQALYASLAHTGAVPRMQTQISALRGGFLQIHAEFHFVFLDDLIHTFVPCLYRCRKHRAKHNTSTHLWRTEGAAQQEATDARG